MPTYITTAEHAKQMHVLKKEIESLQKKVESLREQLLKERTLTDADLINNQRAWKLLANAMDVADSLREQRNMLIKALQDDDCWVRDAEQAWQCFVDENPEADKWFKEE